MGYLISNLRQSQFDCSNKTTIKFLMVFLLLNLPIITFSQTNFTNGYILHSESDTIYGEIDNKDYHSNASFCDFRPFGSDEITRYKPGEIYGYQFQNGKFYISREAPLTDGTVKKIFLEFLIKGELNIYFYQDAEKNNIYYAEKDTTGLMELIYYKIKINDYDQRFEEAEKRFKGSVMNYNTSGIYEYENKRFQGILVYLTTDAPKMRSSILNIKEPSHEGLIKIAKNYHELTCPDEDCLIFEKTIKHNIKVGFSAGHYIITRTSLIEQNPERILSKSGPSVAFTVYFSQVQRSERLFLGLGIRHEFLDVQFGEEIDRANTTRIPLSINYIHPKQGISPLFSYAFDLRSYGYGQILTLGINYQIKKLSFYLAADVDIYKLHKVYATSQRFGLMYNLKN